MLHCNSARVNNHAFAERFGSEIVFRERVETNWRGLFQTIDALIRYTYGKSMIFSCASALRLLAVSAALLLAGCGGGDKEKPAPEAGYVVLKGQSVPIEIELSGRTSPYEVSEVRPQVSGVIKARMFTEGGIVRAGQTLYQIDPDLYRAAAAEAEANLANAEASRAAAQARADRYRPLAEMEAVSKQDYTDALAQARQTGAAVAQGRARVQTARINLNYTRVPAPITGRIGRSAPVRLKLEDGSAYLQVGRLEFTEAVVDSGTGTVTLRARFPNPDGLLLPGMYVRALLSQAIAKEAILAPQQGISRDPGGNATALVVGKDDKAELRTLTADRTVGDKWLVTEGLKPGERLIIEGLGRIKPGQKVRPVPAGSPPAKSRS
jgi:membrane fusion protein (multidrug efflux system)